MTRGCFVAFTVMIGALAPMLAEPASARTLVVAQDGHGTASSCDAPTPTPYTTVSAAVAAAQPHDLIVVCAGTYQEQVTITKPLTLRGQPGAALKPVSMVANTTSLTTGNAIAAVIVVGGVTGVTIEGLTVDGADNGIGSCPGPALAPTPDLFGIFFRNASGAVRDSAIRNLRLPSLPSCRGGTSILVQSANGGRSAVTIEGNSIHAFQRNGITANEVGTSVQIRRNIVTGLGPTTVVQNGIQLARGATGAVEDNVVTQTISTSCVSASSCPANASNVLVGSGSSGILVARNVLGHGQTGVAVFGDENRVQDNVIFETLVFDGIYVAGDGNHVHGNDVTRSDEAGIFIDGNGNRVTNNRINEAPVGLLDGGAGNAFANNTLLNTPVPGPVGP
jgi:parallel beta-helix repeat protein